MKKKATIDWRDIGAVIALVGGVFVVVGLETKSNKALFVGAAIVAISCITWLLPRKPAD